MSADGQACAKRTVVSEETASISTASRAPYLHPSIYTPPVDLPVTPRNRRLPPGDRIRRQGSPAPQIQTCGGRKSSLAAWQAAGLPARPRRNRSGGHQAGRGNNKLTTNPQPPGPRILHRAAPGGPEATRPAAGLGSLYCKFAINPQLLGLRITRNPAGRRPPAPPAAGLGSPLRARVSSSAAPRARA